MVVAKRFRRILVWPNFDVARAADEAASEESKLCNRLTVWPTDEEAAENAEFDEGGSGGGGDDFDGLASIDFKNGVYFWGGATHTLNETIEDGGEDVGVWDANKVIADVGLRLTGTSNAAVAGVLTSGAATAILALVPSAGVVVVATARFSGTVNTSESAQVLITELPVFTTEFWLLEFSHDSNGMQCQIEDNGSVQETLTAGAGPSWKAAGRFTQDAFTGSLDGNATETAVNEPQENAEASKIALYLNIASDDVDTSTAIVERIDFYSAADVANGDLPALSAG